MERFDLDDRHLPLRIVRAPTGFQDDAFQELFRWFEAGFLRKRRYALLIDTTRVVHVPNAAQRKVIADWERSNVTATRRWNVGVALVVNSAVVRGVLTALSWVTPDETPRLHVAKVADGVRWCCERLEADGIPVPPALRHLEHVDAARTRAS